MATNQILKTVKGSLRDTHYSELWKKLSESKEYREQFVEAFVKRAFALQLRMLRKQRGKSQPQFAKESKVDQGVISRSENPEYGNLSFNTVFRIAAGHDLAFIPKVVSFSEFVWWVEEVSKGYQELPNFGEENQARFSTALPIKGQKKLPEPTEIQVAVGGDAAKNWKATPDAAAMSGVKNEIGLSAAG